MILEDRIVIGYYSGETPAVKTAIHNLKSDLVKVTGAQVELVRLDETREGNAHDRRVNIMIASGTTHIFDECAASKACVSVLKKWEGYVIKEHEGILYINGTDKRGTIYGIYDMSEYFGVTAWYYFADVPVRKKERIVIPDGYVKMDYPSVQYRGIFLNDEEELEEWAANHTKDGTIGPELYEKIYELILRLKGNYIWPAMHVNYFQENPENARIASDMGIVVGTSHCDMLMRSNQNEWNPWLREHGYRSDYTAVHSGKVKEENDIEGQREIIYYDYSIPGKNRDVIRQYWRESVEMNKDYEVCYTIGMRGVHDYGFSTRVIDEDDGLDDDGKKAARIKLLEDIMEEQRQMIKSGLNIDNPSDALQSFIPYKEVMDLYDAGLVVPDDVTIIWVNDNFGHIRRYPNDEERKRAGGHGLYYHASYWGTPDMSYTFFNTIPPAHMTNELRKAYASGIRKMWVLNAGALKPLEMDVEIFLDYAWDAGKDTPVTRDITQYIRNWFDNYFSGGFGGELAELFEEYTGLTNARKIEHMAPDVFAQSGYGDEAGERLCRLEKVYERSNVIYEMIPENERDAFFQMYLFKVHSSYYINHAFYYADRSVISCDRNNSLAADRYTEYSGKMMMYFRKMLWYYNVKMCGGKWNGILTPHLFPPPGICFYPPCKPSIRRSKHGKLMVAGWDGTSLTETTQKQHDDCICIEFCDNGCFDRKWIELGNQGVESIRFSIVNIPEWIILSKTAGVLEVEERIYVSMSEDAGPHVNQTDEFYVINERTGGCVTVKISYTDTDGAVYIDASSEAGGIAGISDVSWNEGDFMGWVRLHGAGCGGGDAVMAYNSMLCPADDVNISGNPHVDYTFILNSGGEYLLEVVRMITLDSRGMVRFAVGIDGGRPLVISSDVTDEWRGNWHDGVMDNGERMYVKLPYISGGKHTLNLYMIDNFVTIHKMVIYTKDRRRSFFGYRKELCETDFPDVSFDAVDMVCDSIYGSESGCIDEEIVYADKNFYNYNRIYMKNTSVKQQLSEEKKYEGYYSAWNGCWDGQCDSDLPEVMDVTELFDEGIFTEEDGVIAIDAEYALGDAVNAYRTPDRTGMYYWEQVRSHTCGGCGLAMQVYIPADERGRGCLVWDNAFDAPGMHYRIHVDNAGIYNIWFLMLYENDMEDTVHIALDGVIIPFDKQYGNGHRFTFATAHIYYWGIICSIAIEKGEHVFSVYACDAGMQIDRIYFTKGEELPPVDAGWKCPKACELPND